MNLNDPYIWQSNNTLDLDFCKHCIEKFENDDRKYQGIVGHGVNTDIKRSTDLLINHKNYFKEWENEIQVFSESLCKLRESHINSLLQINEKIAPFHSSYSDISGFQIQRTYPGEYFNWHDDSNIGLFLAGGDIMIRSFTYIWYLNTIDEGGETEFYNGQKIKPEAGKFIIFPATWTYMHRGISPINQTKYICTGWMGILSDQIVKDNKDIKRIEHEDRVEYFLDDRIQVIGSV